MKTKIQLMIIFAITFLIAWILGVLRFEHVWAKALFNIILFPFGLIYAKYEAYCTVNLNPSHLLNNEFLQLLLFGIAIIGQTIIYSFIYKQIKKRF